MKLPHVPANNCWNFLRYLVVNFKLSDLWVESRVAMSRRHPAFTSLDYLTVRYGLGVGLGEGQGEVVSGAHSRPWYGFS